MHPWPFVGKLQALDSLENFKVARSTSPQPVRNGPQRPGAPHRCSFAHEVAWDKKLHEITTCRGVLVGHRGGWGNGLGMGINRADQLVILL